MEPKRAETQHDYAARLLRVLVHIQQHLDDDLGLEQLADIAHFSPFHFHRVFRGMVGESVKQYVRRLRLERAAFHLRQSNRPVTSIAFEAGYEAHEAFSRAFRLAFGASPSRYRAEAVATAPPAPSGSRYTGPDAPVRFTPIPEDRLIMEVLVKDLSPMRVAFIRHTGPYNEVGAAWERLCEWAGRHALFGADTVMFGACYDDPEVTAPEKIRYDACITVDDSVEAEGEIGVQTIAGGAYASVLHEGPYENLKDTYAMLYGQWFAQGTHVPGDPPSLEFYLNDPNSTMPEDLQTEVCVRLRS